MLLKYFLIALTGIFLLGCESESATNADDAGTVIDDPAAPKANTLRGLYVNFADAPIFIDCSYEKRYPVAMEGAHIDLERAYSELDQTPTPALVTVEGRYEERDNMEGKKMTFLVIDKLISMEGGKVCGEF